MPRFSLLYAYKLPFSQYTSAYILRSVAYHQSPVFICIRTNTFSGALYCLRAYVLLLVGQFLSLYAIYFSQVFICPRGMARMFIASFSRVLPWLPVHPYISRLVFKSAWRTLQFRSTIVQFWISWYEYRSYLVSRLEFWRLVVPPAQSKGLNGKISTPSRTTAIILC